VSMSLMAGHYGTATLRGNTGNPVCFIFHKVPAAPHVATQLRRHFRGRQQRVSTGSELVFPSRKFGLRSGGSRVQIRHGAAHSVIAPIDAPPDLRTNGFLKKWSAPAALRTPLLNFSHTPRVGGTLPYAVRLSAQLRGAGESSSGGTSCVD